MSQCTATNRQGNRCGRGAVPGAAVCDFHGGKAPQVRAKAAQRLLEAADPAAAYLAATVRNKKASDADRIKAALGILDRSGHHAKSAMEHSGPDGGDISVAVNWVESEKPEE